jgi:SAM-dependent methyltransferase
MSNWTSGYVADIGYTFGYYPELSPLRAKLAFLDAGLVFPDVTNACELGFGQGVSVNIHAAASATQWFGTDFNPSQASFANEVLAASGAPCHLSDEGFAEFCRRDDLPEFEFVGLHGIWSWISDENRSVIVDFIRRKLKVGGVLYVSYNTLPGWAQMVPLRHLLTEHAEVMAAPGRGIVSRIDAAIEFSEKLFELNPVFARANPPVLDRLKQIHRQNRHYLAHEYFNRDWEPMHFADMANWLEPARISYACSANFFDHVRAFNLTPEQWAFIQEIPDQNFRETVRDFMVNQQFRRDFWVKGARRMSPLRQLEELSQMRVILLMPASEVSMKAQGPLGDVNMNEDIYRPLIDDLAGNTPLMLGHLFEKGRSRGVTTAQVLQGILIMIGRGDISLVQDSVRTELAMKFTAPLNKDFIERVRGGGDLNYLASPVTGGGIAVSRSEQLFLGAISKGKEKPGELAEEAWASLAALGQRLVKEGKKIEMPDDNLAELRSQAENFVAKKMVLLKELRIC